MDKEMADALGRVREAAHITISNRRNKPCLTED